jgi:NhaP-type Na+/H+ or K+/H+ antiporter
MACQWLAWRVKLPAFIFLLLAGIWAGPVTLWLAPDALLGPLLFPFVSLSVET